jgi:hypothetical protein
MKRYHGIDYKHRPATYWEDQDALQAILHGVKGAERRKLITEAWNDGTFSEVPAELLRDTLSENLRNALGALHPALMGGEYLPDEYLGETEIVRIDLQSTTRDVISVRARPGGEGILYRIVDEYATEFTPGRETSKRPLSLAEMIRFLDESQHPDAMLAGIALVYNEVNADCGGTPRERLRHFTRISSNFYPGLSSHYENVFSDWVAEEEVA